MGLVVPLFSLHGLLWLGFLFCAAAACYASASLFYHWGRHSSHSLKAIFVMALYTAGAGSLLLAMLVIALNI